MARKKKEGRKQRKERQRAEKQKAGKERQKAKEQKAEEERQDREKAGEQKAGKEEAEEQKQGKKAEAKPPKPRSANQVADIDISERLNQGWIHAAFSIEVQGNDRKHVNNALNNLIDNFEKNKIGVVLRRKLDKTEEIEKEWFSNNIEVEALFKDYEALSQLSTNYTPATLEIIAPREIKIPSNQLQNAMLNISSMITTFAHAAYMARIELKKARP